MRRYRMIGACLTVVMAAGVLAVCPTQAGPTPVSSILATAAKSQHDPVCATFDSRIWAQTVFDDDPGQHAALDPDRDGLACEDLALGAAPALWTDAVPASAVPVDLASVTDGDTIEVIVNGGLEAVRLVGVDAPEVGGPDQDVECFGPEGTQFVEWLLGLDGEIFIAKDMEEADRFGRLLRWVWLDPGRGEVYLVNEAVIRAGYAERFRDTPNRRYVDELIEAEDFAQRHQLGLWGACDSDIPTPRVPAKP